MANRETYPATQSPLQGDISGPAGATEVTVTGLQTIPVSPATPNPQDRLVYDGVLGEWKPAADGNVSITIGTFVTTGGQIISRGIPISDDYEVSVNGIGLEVLVGWSHGFGYQFFVNGAGVI